MTRRDRSLMMKRMWRNPEYWKHMSEVHKGKGTGVTFQGTRTTYANLHRWVRRKLGEDFWCTWCFSMANIQWANISHKYLKEVGDWFQLCVNCHRQYDRKVNL